MNWEQLQTFHTVIIQGSIIKTAKVLSIHPTTVSRRIAEIEKRIGTRLLKREGNTYVATTDGQRVFEMADEMAKQVHFFEQFQESLNDEIMGTVRITAIESLVVNCLLPRMPELRKQHPRLNLEFISSDLNLSFKRRETDLAIRLSKPSLMNIISKKLGDVGFALYASASPKKDWSKVSYQDMDWVGYEDEYLFLSEAKWLAQKMKKSEPIIKSSNAGILKKAIKVGLGIGVLPCYRGDDDKSLVRISGPQPIVTREAWLLTHNDYRSHPKTCWVIDWITDIFKSDQKRISGQL